MTARPEEQDPRKALKQAKAELRHTEGLWPRILRIRQSMHDLRQSNHFGEAMDEAWSRKQGGNGG